MLTLTPLRLALLAAGILVLAGASYVAGTKRGATPGEGPPALAEPQRPQLALKEFGALAGWRESDPSLAVAAFARSCAAHAGLADEAPANPHEALGLEGVSLGGAASDWRPACAAAAAFLAAPGDAASARGFFETHFRAVTLSAGPERTGRFTAYFEPSYPASDQRTEEFSAPALARPADLVTVDLAAFRDELAGERIAGSVLDGALSPYPDHAAINAGALESRASAIAWTRPTDLLFLQIQGSGRLRVAGRDLRVGYDGHNGHPYTAVGKTLVEKGALPRESVSMQTIRAWLDAAPAAEARAVRETNRSYIFFRRLDDLADPTLGPLGADGVQLTPMVSLAVDPRFTPLGAPVYVDIGAGEAGGEPFRRLMIAQDRGGAIKGPVRGDIFAGAGEDAGAFAGPFNRMGAMTVLLPNAVADRLPREPSS